MAENFKDINTSDISFILNNPWSISNFEWQLAAQEDYDDTILYIKNRLKQSAEDGFYRIWKTDNKEPIAILGFFNTADKKYETFFIASKHMDEHARKVSVDLKKLLREKDAVYKQCTCYLYSGSNHPKQVDWFKFIGFNYIPEKNSGSTKYFEYVSSYK